MPNGPFGFQNPHTLSKLKKVITFGPVQRDDRWRREKVITAVRPSELRVQCPLNVILWALCEAIYNDQQVGRQK